MPVNELAAGLKSAVAPGRLHTVVQNDASAGNDQGPESFQRRRCGQVEVNVEEDRADGAEFLPIHLRTVALDDAVIGIAKTSKAVVENPGATVGVVRDFGVALLSVLHLVVDALLGKALEGIDQHEGARIAGGPQVL